MRSLQASSKASQTHTTKHGTFGWLVEEYQTHAYNFVRLDARQKRNIYLIFESMLREETKAGSGLRFKDCPLGSFLPMHVKLLRDRKNKAPSQANRRVMYVRMAFDWAIEEREGWVKANPATGVKDLKYKEAALSHVDARRDQAVRGDLGDRHHAEARNGDPSLYRHEAL